MSTENDVRGRIAVALDTGDLDEAAKIITAVKPFVGIAKVGLQLFSASGHAAVRMVQDAGMDVFLDVKLHDIPNTVYGASRVLGSLGVRFLTVHASGGKKMLEAAVQGLAEGAEGAGLPSPTALAITVLTSDPAASANLLTERLDAAVSAGCGGIVCASSDLRVIRAISRSITTVVPGIRPAGVPVHDQVRVATPAEAIKSGADILVVGRAITGSDDMSQAARAVAAEVGEALSG
ncbi:orotidine-5'-phosphate decarboxylase [Pseudonocardia sp. GCM10023141]|uniref:orotidine-5'-phosphate decarboxylase n=1 Tax=Pseudonocardia sp. GCM10023141 TaxID=3252653 RepID=UPI00361EF8EC